MLSHFLRVLMEAPEDWKRPLEAPELSRRCTKGRFPLLWETAMCVSMPALVPPRGWLGDVFYQILPMESLAGGTGANGAQGIYSFTISLTPSVYLDRRSLFVSRWQILHESIRGFHSLFLYLQT